MCNTLVVVTLGTATAVPAAWSGTPCAADLNGDQAVDSADLALLLGAWGSCPLPCPPFCAADLDQDCMVDSADLALLLGSWGLCPGCGGDAQCNDDNACTTDTCVDGVCVHEPVDCDDQDPCTFDVCSLNGGCGHSPINCDDGNACTVDSCSGGQCVHEPVDCNDQDPCTFDVCSIAQGCGHSPVDCSDGDPCTVDSCVAGQCMHEFVDCSDGLACTQDFCTGDGGCVHAIPGGDCCVNHADPGCFEGPCCECVCAQDPFCCDVVWDSNCVGIASELPCEPLCGC